MFLFEPEIYSQSKFKKSILLTTWIFLQMEWYIFGTNYQIKNSIQSRCYSSFEPLRMVGTLLSS